MNAILRNSTTLRLIGLLVLIAGTLAPVSSVAQVAAGPKDKITAKGKTQESQIEVREKELCELLRKAAVEKPGKMFRGKIKGDKKRVKFKGHEPWVAELLCTYVEKAAGSRVQFLKYDERKKYLEQVLRAFSNNLDIDVSYIDFERLRVGAQLFEVRRIINSETGKVEFEAKDVVDPKTKKKKRQIYNDVSAGALRSWHKPDLFLLGVNAKYFVPFDSDSKPTPLDLIARGEDLLTEAYLAAETGELAYLGNYDFPHVDFMDEADSRMAEFKRRYAPNSKTGTKKSRGSRTRYVNRLTQDERKKAAIERNPDHVKLEFEKILRPGGIEGLTLFQYRPMRGRAYPAGANPRSWFVESLPGGKDSGGGESEGITVPIGRFRAVAPDAVIDADSLFDEETSTIVETRFNFDAMCAIKIHYYSQVNKEKKIDIRRTNLVRDHELGHFGGIAAVWQKHTREIEPALERLAEKMNGALNLQGGEAFSVRRSDSGATDIWRLPEPKSKPTVKEWRELNALAIPKGSLQPKLNAAEIHQYSPVALFRISLVRRFEPGVPFHEMLSEAVRSGMPADPQYTKAKGLWDSWNSEVGYLYDRAFYRDFRLSELAYDIENGTLGEKGYSGRTDLIPVLNAFRNRTKGDRIRTLDPRDVYDEIVERLSSTQRR